MLLRTGLLCLFIFVVIFSYPASAIAQQDELSWGVIAQGIEYRKFQLPDPNDVFVVRMDRSNPSLTLESSIGQGKLSEGRETVSSMYARYDQSLSFWGGSANPPTWGMRNKVAVAINGSYFDLNTGIPWSGQVQSGWYAKRFDDLGGGSGFAWMLDRSAIIGDCIFHRPEKQLITYPITHNTQQIAHVNTPRDADELVVYTPQYNSYTRTDNSGVEVVVEMMRPTMILPEPAYASGIVRQVRIGEGNSLIPFNSIVLSASGTASYILEESAHVGDEIRISQEITSYEGDCATPFSLNWTKTYASIAGAYFFLKNGQILDYDDPGATARHPRTAILYNDQYIFFLVVNGRDYMRSVGMSIHELAVFGRDTLGATWGVAQDGGGSSTMVINGQVVNKSNCAVYTPLESPVMHGDYIYFLPSISSAGSILQPVLLTSADDDNSSPCNERPVANGMMMVIVQPGIFSTTFVQGEVVTALNDTELRLGPGTNYDTFATIPMGTQGSILEQINGLNGVLATSTYWWYVNLGGVNGWVPEAALQGQPVVFEQVIKHDKR
jgi:hypothetical protein